MSIPKSLQIIKKTARKAMLSTEQQYTQAQIDEANQSRIDANAAHRAIKESKSAFVNLQEKGQYVNTLDPDSAYIHVSRWCRLQVDNHEEVGITVSLISPVASESVFLPAVEIWAKLWVYGGAFIENRYYCKLPDQETIDRAVEQLRRRYEVALNG